MSDDAAARPGRGGSVWLPTLLVLGVAATSWWTFNHSSRAVAERVIYLYGASLILGPSVVYPWMRRRGASGRLAVAGSLVVPLVWLIKEGYRITANFSVGEAFYYALNPMAQSLYTAIAIQVSLIEIGIRRRRTGRWQLLWAPALALTTVLAHSLFLRWVAAQYGAAQIFYSYAALHARLFGGE